MDADVGKVLDLVEKAVKCFIEKFKSIKDFDKDLEAVQRKVKQLSDKTIDMKTEVENQEQSGKKRRTEVESWFDEVGKIEEELRELKEEVTREKKNVGTLKKMNGRVGELLDQSNNFRMLVHDMYQHEECPLLVPQVHEEPSIQNLEVIWTWLHDENISSIGIYGMGGVGKTTLAKHIHNLLLEERHYHVYWVTVSQGFSIKRLQDKLAKIVHLDLSNEDDEHKRVGQLNSAFKKWKYIVIILDDVWDRLCLEKLGDPLGVEGCRLILTTRSYEVCKKMDCQKLLEVQKLNPYDAWELFRKSLECETLLSPDIEQIAKSMAEKCQGLPLGLITLSRSMSGVTDIREWKNALKEFPDDMERDVFKVLQFSYDQLRDPTMQECFLYCALYPEDCKIDRDELIDRFMMEGPVKGHSRQEEFNQGHTILNKLVKLCLLEATDDRGYEAVKMHDLLREMALWITNVKPRYMVRARIGSQVPEEQDWAFDLDKVSFFKSGILGIPEDVAPSCPTLSTLLLPYCRLRRIPDSFFQHMNNLQVLDLSHNSILMDLPSCISNLGSLRALSLRKGKQLRSVPPLGKLKNLRVFDVSYTGIKEVPQGMEKLVKLKFLNMGGIDLDEMPKEILPKLSQLQFLYLPLRMNALVEDLARLELLEEFGCRFWDLCNFYKFMRNRRQDCWYDIRVSESPDFIKYNSGIRRIQQRRVTFEDLHLENLVGLCKGKIASHTFSGLTELEIKGCHKMKKLFPRAIFQDLKKLEKLYVIKCREMEETIGREEEGSGQSSNPLIISTSTILPKLKELYLHDLPKLKRIYEGKLMCDSLQYMKFRWCPNLKRLPFYTPTTNEHPFPSLRRIYIYQFWWERLELEQPHVKTLLQPYIRYLRD